MDVPCGVKTQAATPAVAIRLGLSGPDPDRALRHAIGRVAEFLREIGEKPAGPPFAAFRGGRCSGAEAQAGYPVCKPLHGKGDVVATELPGGRVATCVYTGPLLGIDEAYDALREWMEDFGHEGGELAWELYWSDPEKTAPERLKTQIVIPLR